MADGSPTVPRPSRTAAEQGARPSGKAFAVALDAAAITARNDRRRTLAPRLRRIVDCVLGALQAALCDIERDLDDTLRRSPVRAQITDLLTGVPGIGDPTVRTRIADLPERGTSGRREIVALAGVAPFNRGSGILRGRSTTCVSRPI